MSKGEPPVRMPSRQLDKPWPFRLSYVKGRGLVRNVQPEPKVAPSKSKS